MEAVMPRMLTMDAEALKKYRTWYMIYGVVLIALGLFAIAMPNVATLAVELMIGWLLVIGGVFGLIAAFSGGQSTPGFWWNLLVAVLYLLAGIALLWHPVAGAVTLTLILVAYLIAGGIVKAVMSVNLRSVLPKAWGWMLFSALVDIALAALILSGWPGREQRRLGDRIARRHQSLDDRRGAARRLDLQPRHHAGDGADGINSPRQLLWSWPGLSRPSTPSSMRCA
jgi:uncharacterized membrane protein HdeD (DUF308 family)